MELSPEHAELLRRLDDIASDLRIGIRTASFVVAAALLAQAGRTADEAANIALDLVAQADQRVGSVMRTHADLRSRRSGEAGAQDPG